MKTKGDNRKSETSATVRAGFPVVGIGASAGGLAAFEAFFSNMPLDTDSPMAFVLVQHLAPDHKSILSELIGRYTRMNVFEVEDGMVVRPNCAYIIPPGRDMALQNGSLQLLEPSAPRGQRLPIDFFFRSLAQDQKERSIGIILSGTASDGTLGVRAIKGEGGMVMVQTPDSTEFDGMPRSALATGLVDYELPPEEMPASLVTYVAHILGKAPLQMGEEPTPEVESHLKNVFLLLRSHTGHDFSLYKPSSIIRRIQRRMAIHQIDSMESYVAYLQHRPEETDSLFRDLLIGVTSFFRDPEVFEIFEQVVVSRLLADASHGSAIRVWTPGCSTGEEAYSIAILLYEAMERSDMHHLLLQVFATDIDAQAIAVARAGVYSASSVAEISQERLSRFFTAEPSGPDVEPHSFRINKNIRDILIFSEQNMIKDPPLSRMNLITCRNVMIYLSADLQKKLIPMFHYALNPGGMLFLGTSESVGEFSDLFTELDRKAKLYQRNDKSLSRFNWTPGSFLPSIEPAQQVLPRGLAPPRKASLRELAEQTLLQQLAPASALVDRNGAILYLHGRTGKYLEPATGEVGPYNILKMAREGLQYELSIALRQAVQNHEIVRRPGLNVKTNDHFTPVDLSICPVAARPDDDGADSLYLVVLEDGQPVEVGQGEAARDSAGDHGGADHDTLVASLRQELQAKDEFLRTAKEELEAFNAELSSSVEEMQSMNEELQSTNEELETSKEELQSVNEELAAVNVELQAKVADLSHSNNDMNNLLAGTGIATVFLDLQLRILRFTPTASELINLIPGDEGRPAAHILSNLVGYDRMIEDAKEVLETLIPKKLEVQTTGGSWFNMGLLPYRTLDNVIEGVVINFVDITHRKQVDGELRKHLSEKEILLQEVHHRIRNNITSIGSLLSTQAQMSDNPEVLSILQDAIGRVRSMSVLYDNLLIRQEYEGGSVKSYVETLVDSLIAAFPVECAVTVEKDLTDFALVPAQLFPLGIIINELFTNVMKYAFFGKESGVVAISLAKSKSHVTLTVRDNGIGLPENFASGESKGFGLTLIGMLSEQLGGQFSIATDEGTTSMLEFEV